MARPDLCTTEEIRELVDQFYARIRSDAVLGPIFNEHIHDWPTHLDIMVRFWSSILLGSGQYSGTPMPKHIALPGLDASMFRHWLALFHQTTAELSNRDMAHQAEELAQRIARSLWFGYQMHREPNRMPQELSHE
ncbi:MAG TPA: group III truncated hemoglobin [Burkholderiaceae bacterium]|nr:group III truncated hemoglobin [Burkholderiaceae bacterium]